MRPKEFHQPHESTSAVKLPFGKYKGLTLWDLAVGGPAVTRQEGRKYLEWLGWAGFKKYWQETCRLALLGEPVETEAEYEAHRVTTEPGAAAPVAEPVIGTEQEAMDAGQQLAELVRRLAAGAVDEDRVKQIATDISVAQAMALTDRLSQLESGLDREKIAHIVAEEAAKVRQVELTVKVNGRPPVVLDGVQHVAFQESLELAAMGKPVLLIGPSGCGKTTLARQVAKALARRFGSCSFTNGMSEGALMGKLLPTGEGGAFEYWKSEFVDLFENGGLFLGDELDGADPNVLLIWNQGISNRTLPVPNRTQKPYAERHPEFTLMAAANTFGRGADRLYVGRNQLDEATLDRFRIGTIEMDYDRELEEKLCKDQALLMKVWEIRERCHDAQMRRVVSTRFLCDAQDMMQGADWSMTDVMGKLTEGWSNDERTKVGLSRRAA